MSPQIVVAAQYGAVIGVILWLGAKIKLPAERTNPRERPWFRDHTYDGRKKG